MLFRAAITLALPRFHFRDFDYFLFIFAIIADGQAPCLMMLLMLCAIILLSVVCRHFRYLRLYAVTDTPCLFSLLSRFDYCRHDADALFSMSPFHF